MEPTLMPTIRETPPELHGQSPRLFNIMGDGQLLERISAYSEDDALSKYGEDGIPYGYDRITAAPYDFDQDKNAQGFSTLREEKCSDLTWRDNGG